MSKQRVTVTLTVMLKIMLVWVVQFLRLGREGYTKIMQNLGLVAQRLQKGIEDTGVPLRGAVSVLLWLGTAL